MLVALVFSMFFGWFYFSSASNARVDLRLSLLGAFSASAAALQMGYSESAALAMAEKPFFNTYSQLASRLAAARKRPAEGDVNYLAAAALLAAGASDPGQQQAAMKLFLRYYPDVIDDPVLFGRVIVTYGLPAKFDQDSPIAREARQGAWRVAGRSLDQARLSGVTVLPELTDLTALFPGLEAMIKESLNPALPPINNSLPVSEIAPATEPENAT